MNNKLVYFCLSILVAIIPCNGIIATHIYGGDFSYKCLGTGSDPNSRIFNIKYNMFIDCHETNNPDLIVANMFENGSQELFPLFLDSTILVQEIDYSCTEIQSQFCFNQLIYSGQIELLENNFDTHLYFQLCCRTEILENIESSADGVGFTHLITITPFAKETCNTSPFFENSTPATFCKDEIFQLSQHAIDLDGDQLIYEFYTPLNFEEADIPPDFSTVSYDLPQFSTQSPLGDEVLSLNAFTGLLSGSPNLAGSFLIGICVKEYRNGVLLSKTLRDIQLNIVDCEPFVTANIQSNEILQDDTHIITVCNDQTVTFENLSTQQVNISNVLWSFNMESNVVTYTDWNPVVNFEEPGSFNGNLIINPNQECSDTLNFVVNVVGAVISEFTASYDTCIGGPVSFSNNSFSLGSDLDLFDWNFGDGTIGDTKEPEKIYDSPDAFEVQLKVIDEFGCTDSVSTFINWQPAPAIIIISPEEVANCSPLTTTFTNLSWPIDTTYRLEWDFGDGTLTYDELSPMHTYWQEGVYDVSVSVQSPIGCIADTTFQNLMLVEKPPEADFIFKPEAITQLNSTITITDYSLDAITWQWLFDSIEYSYVEEPIYMFKDTGYHTIRLVVADIYGCTDTMLQIIDVMPTVTYFLPNAFTPNGDGVNDVFEAKGYIESLQDFDLKIFDRWGSIIFSTSSPTFEWDGFDPKTGRELSQGVYVYITSYRTTRGEEFQDKGYVTLLR